MGKTRLAIQAAREMLASYPDGVWIVDLAPISDPALVPQTVSVVLQMRELGSLSIISRLIEHLQDKKCLLLLDNCEHLVQACAQLVNELLQACLDLSVLATSQETLGIMGEYSYRISGLAAPDAYPMITEVDALVKQESIRLFVDRARNVLPDFQVTLENAPALVSICRQLEGMPLAIELAAARVQLLNVEQIAARLEDTFRLLRGSIRTAHPRQQTLYAAISWSTNLLTDPEKVFLWRLSVFAGGWDLEAAEAIGGGDSVLPAEEILDVLDSLVNKSLVIAIRVAGTETRYRMLDTIRQFALQKLSEAGELEVIQARHCEYMSRLVERAEPDLSQELNLVGWEDRLELEHDNLRAALEWSLNNDRIETAMRIAVNLFVFWYDRSYFQEGRKWYDAGLQSRDRLSQELLARVLRRAGRFSSIQGNYELAEQYGYESVRIFQELGDKYNLADALSPLSAAIFARGEIETSREMDLKMLELYREAEDEPGIALALAYIGWDEVLLGKAQQGIQRLEQSLAMQRKMGSKFGLAFSMMVLGKCLYQQGEMDRAEELLSGALSMFNDQKNKTYIRNCLIDLAGIAAFRRRANRATILIGIANRLMEIAGTQDSPVMMPLLTETLSLIHTQLDDDTYNREFSLGRKMADGDLSEAVAYALESSA